MKQSVFTVLLPDKNLRETFQLLRELDYDGVEIRVKEDYHLSPSTISSYLDELKGLQSEFGLQVPVLSTYLPVTDHRALFPVFRAAEALGVSGVRVSLGKPYSQNLSYWQLRDRAMREIESFISAVHPGSVKALFEIHFKTIIASPSLAYLLLQNFDPAQVGVIFDPGNMVIEGYEDPYMGTEIIKDYLAHVHIKNASWKSEAGQWVHQWEDLECGIAVLEDVIKALKRIGYEGYLSNENLKDVQLPGASGFIGETLSSADIKTSIPIGEKLSRDKSYLDSLLLET